MQIGESSSPDIDYLDFQIESVRSLYGCFRIGPLDKGQGLTLGNALRRILLENLETLSFVSMKIENITHEFSVLPGVRESILEILLNLKQVVLKGKIIDSNKAFISFNNIGIITASDIQCPTGVQIVDKNQYIATVSKKQNLHIELELASGAGYRQQSSSVQDSSILSLEGLFMPVTKANYKIQYEFVDDSNKKEYVYIEIWTNGSLQPDLALQKAANILIGLVNPICHFNQKTSGPSKYQSEFHLNEILIEQLQLSVRSYNCLKRAQISTVADLLKYTKQDLLEIKNFGEKSADEVMQSVEEFLKGNKIQIEY